ncbi:MAG TPA: glycoside hydrolase family 9 protein [Gemmatimonadaceae bacterium]|nr:glycoside hydrolase family 9 protein [Gemmatimonadaceae bacterium]
MLFALLAALTTAAADSTTFIRVNQVGYLPDAPKVAVACSLDSARVTTFVVRDERDRVVFGPRRAQRAPSFGPCVVTHRLDFSALRRSGRYRIVAGELTSPIVRIGAHVYDGGADTLLYYMRQQRSGWNPLFRDSVHTHDGIVVDVPDTGRRVAVSGGWADASDYLQYVATSANATFVMLMAYRDHPGAFADHFQANGTPGSNGVADVLDEARHGLEWLARMFADDGTMFNQIADDRDHAFFDLPTNDSSDYGWGRGRERPVYPCTGAPQGLFQNKNRSTGLATTAGKYASAFGLGAQLLAPRDSAFATVLRRKAREAYALGRAHPGVCQTAPGRAPYFYEEDNWADDMELGAAILAGTTRQAALLDEATAFAAQEPVTPWMGADTASHYQWFPWHNNGHYETWRVARARGDVATQRRMVDYYRRGLLAVLGRAGNGFRIGVPFIWCSNNLMTSFATQAMLYRRMTGDQRFRPYEQAALDWLFGTNPWGVSMVIGYPHAATTAQDPHSAVAARLGVDKLLGGLLDGPVYRTIYGSLRGITLHQPDEYARFNTGRMVYHDDLGDYSTNEPIMDGTASLTYLLSGVAARR